MDNQDKTLWQIIKTYIEEDPVVIVLFMLFSPIPIGAIGLTVSMIIAACQGRL